MGRKVILATALALFLGATNSWAMDQEGPGGMHKQGGPGGGMAGIADLTADQKAKLKAIGEAQKAEVKPLHEQAKTTIKELKALVDSKAGDAVITAKLDELKKIRESIQVITKKYMEQREQVLTPTQKAGMALKMGDRMGDRKTEKMGMKGKKGAKCTKEEGTEEKD